ncbi:hypothetical protein TNCV_617831 [Trichonephila clavipes]|nr:hypothetical protein TNCV_617831 [Trichonephila clavipes]
MPCPVGKMVPSAQYMKHSSFDLQHLTCIPSSCLSVSNIDNDYRLILVMEPQNVKDALSHNVTFYSCDQNGPITPSIPEVLFDTFLLVLFLLTQESASYERTIWFHSVMYDGYKWKL